MPEYGTSWPPPPPRVPSQRRCDEQQGGREDREVRGVFTAKPKTPDSDHYRRLFDKEAVMGPEIDDRWRR